MTEQRLQIEEHARLLKAAEAAMGEQGQRLDSLAEALRPHVEARWGVFAGSKRSGSVGEEHEFRGPSQHDPMVTLTTRANMPVPPLYRGSSKQEKRDFMDSYMVYKRRVDALNQGTQTQVFVMPIGACIQQSTLVRICRFKLFKPKATVTEEDWKRYILGARNPDFTTYKQLDVAVRGLTVDVQLQDAESCMSRLLANFYSTVDGVNMESIIHEDPKRVVGYLVMPYVQRPIVLPSKKVWSALLPSMESVTLFRSSRERDNPVVDMEANRISSPLTGGIKVLGRRDIQ
ncbi:hypothetical protein L914_15629 [Phytophthora nicotianae]|uniref:Uncharacterized protein n=1 Tax=Phytophthora nicotianae TaxID=4792 RepID=W2MNN0_PHYNI|nr:hypothetical protein L914_15629 [Phytophthora nicotianae]